ncbi:MULTISPECIES: toxin glutamine deamidase domain-containing protein [unclassified Kribbella]|uniref:toxin glutamine deamidase domain-containing protein n=1 Tax=unclassified Kribbella TaxID=2644121 RepID=UPI003016E4B9
MIQPEGIPVEELNHVVEALEANISPLSALGEPFTDVGSDIHNTFQGLNEVYEAPERELLVSSTLKVKTNLDEFGPSLPAMAGHLATLADELRSRARELEVLRSFATSWHESKEEEGEDWQQNQGLVDINNDLVAAVNRIMTEELPELCFTAANEIVKLHGGDTWDPETGLREGEEAPPASGDEAEPEPPPWGDEEDVDYPPWADVAMFPGNFCLGVLTVAGQTLEGILTLVPVLPALNSQHPGLSEWLKDTFNYDMPTWEDSRNAWKGVGMMLVQVALAPQQFGAWVGEEVFGIERSEEMKASTETGLSMVDQMFESYVAWDEWKENPGKALGMVTTNVFLTVVSFGAGAGIKAAAMAGRYGVAAARVAKAANFVDNLRVTVHDTALSAALKIPTVRDVVNGLSEIPILGENFKFHGNPPVDVTADAPDLTDSTSATSFDSPDVTTDTSSFETSSLDSPTIDTPDIDAHDTTYTPSTDSTPNHTDPGATTPASPADPGSTTPVWHTDPGTTTPVWHTDPSTTPTTRLPDSTTPPTTRVPDSTTPPTTRVPDSTTPPTTRPPDPTRPLDTSRTTEMDAPRSPESTRTSESDAAESPESTRTSESDAAKSPESTRTSESNAPKSLETTHTPETARKAQTGTSNTPRTTHPPENTPTTPTTHSPEGTPQPAAARTADPVVPPVMPMHPGVPNHTGTPNNPSTPNTPNAPTTPHAPTTPNTPGGPRPEKPWEPFAPLQQRPFGPPPSRHPDANKPTDRPSDPKPVDVPNEREPVDAANDPNWDDRLRRQVEIDKLKPAHTLPAPGKPRSDIDPNQYIAPDPTDARRFELVDAVGNQPLRNVRAWMGKVNPYHRLSKVFQMNCGDGSRKTSAILNGDSPELAAGRKFAGGENPEATLEWMDLDDFKPGNKMAAPDTPHNPADFTNAAYRRVYDELIGKPAGTHAQIFVTWKSTMPGIPGNGHVFNAFVDQRGRVNWLDTQPPGGKLMDAYPDWAGWKKPHPINPHPGDITSIQFATRIPGGKWDGVPRTPNTPPASQLQFQRPQTPLGDRRYMVDPASLPISSRIEPPPSGGTPYTSAPSRASEPNVPEPVTPDMHTPDTNVPEPGMPDSSAPESDAPEAAEQYGGLRDLFKRRSGSDATQPVPENPIRSAGQPASPGRRVPSELADRNFRASDQDKEEMIGTDPSYSRSRVADKRERGRLELGGLVDDLSDAELLAMDKMLQMDHRTINKDLRAGDPDAERLPVVRNAVSALNKLPDFRGEIHRGIEIAPEELQEFVNRYKPGATVPEVAFTHSDKSKGSAHGGNVHLVIDARHGKDLSFMRERSVNQNEVMHPPHTTFYPTRLEYDESTGKVELWVRDHGGPADPPPGGWPELPTVGGVDPRHTAVREQVEGNLRPVTPDAPQEAVDPFANPDVQYKPTEPGSQAWQQPPPPEQLSGPYGSGQYGSGQSQHPADPYGSGDSQQPVDPFANPEVQYRPTQPGSQQGQFGPEQGQAPYQRASPEQSFGPGHGQPDSPYSPTQQPPFPPQRSVQPEQQPFPPQHQPGSPYGPPAQHPVQPPQHQPGSPYQHPGQPSYQQPGQPPYQHPPQPGSPYQQPGQPDPYAPPRQPDPYGPPMQRPPWSPQQPERPQYRPEEHGPSARQMPEEPSLPEPRRAPDPGDAVSPGSKFLDDVQAHRPDTTPNAPDIRPETPGTPAGRPEDHGFDAPDQVRRAASPEAEARFLAELREASARWDGQDVQDLNEFGGSTANLINRMLRNPAQGMDLIRSQTPHLTEWIDRVDGLIRDAPRVAEPRTLFRGLAAPQHVRSKADFRQWVQETFGGGRFNNPGYTSTTMNPERAADFANQGGAKFGVVVEIRSPQGLPLGKVTHDRVILDEVHEGEYALPRDFGGRIVGISDGVPFDRRGGQEPYVVIHVVDDSLPSGPLPDSHSPDTPGAPGSYPPGTPEGPHPDQPQTQARQQPQPQQGGPSEQYGGQLPHSQDGAQPSQPQYGGQPPGGSPPAAGGQDWRPGDSGFGVSNKPGFDPAFHHKALGDEFAPGVHDPDGKFVSKERKIADDLEQEGWRVDARREDHTVEHLKNPEAMVRKDPADEGRITEFKTLEPTPNGKPVNAAKRNINDASDQVPPDGEVVIDASKVGLTEAEAEHAFRKARGQHGKTVAAQVHIILGDGRIVTYPKES